MSDGACRSRIITIIYENIAQLVKHNSTKINYYNAKSK